MLKAVILGIDNFSRKNIKQIEYMNRYNISFDIFTNNSLGDSQINIPRGNKVYILKKSILSRLFQILGYLLKEHKNITHVEVYPGGRFAVIYIILSKLFGKKVVLVERGDVGYLDTYNKLLQFSAKWSYKFADIVWYREFYMKRKLEIFKAKRLFFLSNCIQIPNITNSHLQEKVFDFLWVNRLIPQRKSNWFIDVINEREFISTYNAMLGIINDIEDKLTIENQQYAESNKSKNLIIENYINPTEYYLNSKFFVLPSDIVFCNNALLEAMSYGVVPLVSDVEGARLIVDDGINGFIFEHSKEGLREAMIRALNLSEEQYEAMSHNAIAKVKREFDYEIWGQKLLNLYMSI